ncbi:hypothetical protein [Bacillus sp. UNC438CL73TsuS30]|uniref:hypothetical protein n=1 Tax=Bacillus sp. UNC438CL73TsuS30 TaxID=1340434 RepID=UPI00047B6BC7|nr:hypothetical protein [Bacillus sp. UNC438CL73TsuS30]
MGKEKKGFMSRKNTTSAKHEPEAPLTAGFKSRRPITTSINHRNSKSKKIQSKKMARKTEYQEREHKNIEEK